MPERYLQKYLNIGKSINDVGQNGLHILFALDK